MLILFHFCFVSWKRLQMAFTSEHSARIMTVWRVLGQRQSFGTAITALSMHASVYWADFLIIYYPAENKPISSYHNQNRQRTGFFSWLHFMKFTLNCVPQTINSHFYDSFKYCPPETETTTYAISCKKNTSRSVTELTLRLFSKFSTLKFVLLQMFVNVAQNVPLSLKFNSFDV